MSINKMVEKIYDGKALLHSLQQQEAAIIVKREAFKSNSGYIRNDLPIIDISRDNYKYFDQDNKFLPQRLGAEILSILSIKKGPLEGLFYLDCNILKPADHVVKQLISQLLGNRYTQYFERDTISYLKSYLPEQSFNSGNIPKLTCLSNIEPEKVSWLWEPYLPIGKITLLDGDPGLGKTFLSLAIAAAVSNGWPLLDKNGQMMMHLAPANVLYLTAEDGLGDTLRPRLDKAGADVSKIYVLEGKVDSTKPEESKPISLMDINVLSEAMDQVKPVLVVIDPIQAYLGDANMSKAEQVRPLLSALGRLVEKHRAAVIIIRHLTKSAQDRSIYRGLGTIDFIAAARSSLLVGKDPDDESKRVMVHTKSSLSEHGKSIGFMIDDNGFQWLGHVETTAAQVLAPEKSEYKDDEIESPMKEARKYLIDSLQDGPKPAKDILDSVKFLGFGIVTLKKAKAALKIQSYKNGDSWMWAFPPDVELEGGDS